MNTKQLLLAMTIVAGMSTAALANDAPAAPAAPEAKQEMKTEKFEERKAKALQRISERIANMQKKQACVQAATTPEAFKACFPNWGKRGGMHRGMMHEGGEEGTPK